MAYKVVDLFAGVGGLSYGFAHDPAFEIIAANEILKPMAEAYSQNHPNVKVYNKDIKEFSIEDLTRDLGVKKGDVDVVVMCYNGDYSWKNGHTSKYATEILERSAELERLHQK